MAKKKTVPEAAAAGSSRNAERKTMENLECLHARLAKELEELQKEIQQLHRQIAGAAERLESTTTKIDEMEKRLLAAVEERHAVQREVNLILQQGDLGRLPEKAWWKKKRWICPTVAVTVVLFASTALMALSTKSSKNGN